MNKITQQNMALMDLTVLYVQSGYEHMPPYKLISTGIINSLKMLVKNVLVANPSDDLILLVKQYKPELLLVLLGDQLPTAQIEAIRGEGTKTAVWLTDDPYYVDRTITYVTYYDYIFTNEISTITLYQTLGCKRVYYLPLAVNQGVFYPNLVARRYHSDICFVGTAWKNRIEFIDKVKVAGFLARKKVKIIGPMWEKIKNFRLKSKVNPVGVPMEETAKYFCGAKIVINLHRSHDDQTLYSENSLDINAFSINPRAFEISGCGVFQLTDVREDLSRCYKIGKEVETFSSEQEFIDKIDYYLLNQQKRQEIALKGLERTLKDHTYVNRLLQLIQIVI